MGESACLLECVSIQVVAKTLGSKEIQRGGKRGDKVLIRQHFYFSIVDDLRDDKVDKQTKWPTAATAERGKKCKL